jgi:hypothetical protein
MLSTMLWPEGSNTGVLTLLSGMERSAAYLGATGHNKRRRRLDERRSLNPRSTRPSATGRKGNNVGPMSRFTTGGGAPTP